MAVEDEDETGELTGPVVGTLQLRVRLLVDGLLDLRTPNERIDLRNSV